MKINNLQSKIKESLKKFIKNQVFFLIIIILIISAIVTLFNRSFLDINNFKNILLQISVVTIMAFGAGIVIISGGLDLSVGSMVSLISVISATLIANGKSVFIALLAGLTVALICGFFNGIIIAKTNVAPFIATLGSMSIFASLSIAISKGGTALLRNRFEFIGRGVVLNIPVQIYIMFFIFIILFVLLNYTKLGRRIYGIGGSEEVSFLAGINVQIHKILVYCLNSFLVFIASMILISRTGSAIATVGNGLELKAIAAAIIGGVALSGGKGKLFGIFLGSLLLGIIQNMLNILNLSAHFQAIVVGSIIVIAVTTGRQDKY